MLLVYNEVKFCPFGEPVIDVHSYVCSNGSLDTPSPTTNIRSIRFGEELDSHRRVFNGHHPLSVDKFLLNSTLTDQHQHQRIANVSYLVL